MDLPPCPYGVKGEIVTVSPTVRYPTNPTLTTPRLTTPTLTTPTLATSMRAKQR